ncbi:Uncharacterised protein [Yersinia mollaretii]|uniref:Uncharacterized protein n=1 Tax=Yersinia mollaretii TaxID=33060 RepID=A0AA36LNR4_YERMO|nr:Uncharacterised protein [Yersinia mollaretii]CNI39342.1 Uncharacterised protein [Yersinia mollaretii]CQJ15050.1 Uncharacterised protein [Yersinia mollaretii]
MQLKYDRYKCEVNFAQYAYKIAIYNAFLNL